MHSSIDRPRINAIQPQWALQGGRFTIEGTNLISDGTAFPVVHLGTDRAQVVTVSDRKITAVVPAEAKGGTTPVRIEGALGERVFLRLVNASLLAFIKLTARPLTVRVESI